MKQKLDERDFEAIRNYIKQNGFGQKTPPLTKTLSADTFSQHYYDKKELQSFCRSVGISVIGLKSELNERIDLFLRTGKVTKVSSSSQSQKPDSELGLSLNTIVVTYKSDPITRAFFQKHIPNFSGFSAYIQKWLKQRLANGEKFTYKDIIEEHQQYLRDKNQAKAQGKTIRVAHDSCEFNQFYIDYSHDPAKKPHTAKEAWQLVRNSAGEKTYQYYKEKIREVSQLLKK